MSLSPQATSPDISADISAAEAATILESLTYAHSADLAPTCQHVAFSLSRIVDDVEQFELIVTELSTGTQRLIGSGHDPAWSPDGQTVAYVCRADDKSQIFAWSLGDESPTQLTHLPQGVLGGLAWHPAGEVLAFSALPAPTDRSKPYRVTRIVGWRDGFGLVDDSATDVWVHDLPTGESRPLTSDGCVNFSPTWLAQSDELAYIATMQPDDWADVNVLRAVTLDGVVRDIFPTMDVTAIADAPAEIGQFVMTSGGKFHDTPGELFVVHHDGSTESRSATLGLDVIGDILGDLPVPYADLDARVLVSGHTAVVRVQKQDRLEIYRLELQGDESGHLVAASDGCLYPLALAGDTLLYASGEIRSAPDLWVRDLGTGVARKLTDTAQTNAQLLRPVTVERGWASAADGPDVQLKFLRPHEATGPLPTVLIVHGGPYTTFGEAFESDAQLLCEAGYGVLLVNPRGSRGYGSAFSTAIDGDWGNADYADLMAAVDHAVAEGWADPDRLGVTGVSYGGYMTAWIIAHTHRFKAAVYENGVSNFVSMYGTSDVGLSYLPEALGGTPWDNLDTYVRCSPITTAHTAITPTLLIVGEGDQRCPPEQALQLYAVLRRAGCTAELLMLPGAAHAGSVHGSPATRRAQNEGLVDWMNRFV